MEIPGIESYLDQHPLGPTRRMVDAGRIYEDENGNVRHWSPGEIDRYGKKGYTQFAGIRGREDIKNDVAMGHKFLGTDMDELKGLSLEEQHDAHERAERYGTDAHRLEYFARHRGLDARNQPLPGMEDMDAPIVKSEPGVHPESQAAIIVPNQVLPEVLASGKFKNAFEVGGGIGGQLPAKEQWDEHGNIDHYSNMRRDAESYLFDIPFKEDDPNARPVYGLVRDKRRPGIDPVYVAGQYGDAVVDLKDPTKTGKSATVTKGDSLDSDPDLDDVNTQSTNPDTLEDWGDYTEMQWHDHPGTADIERVHLKGHPKSDNGMIGQQFLRAGIPVTHHWTHYEYQPSLWESTPITNPLKEQGLRTPKIFSQDVARDVTEDDYKDN